jgi:hypothetical protein
MKSAAFYYTLGVGFLRADFGFNSGQNSVEKRAFSSLGGTKRLAKTIYYKAFFGAAQGLFRL